MTRDEMLEKLEGICSKATECTPNGCRVYGVCDNPFCEMTNKKLKEICEALDNEDATESGDMVESPSHYTAGGIEVIDYIRAKLTPEEFEGYCKGNVLKYLSRAGLKGDKKTDYSKALRYMEWLCE